MDKRIIYQNENGGVSVIIPADCGLTIDQIAAKDVPGGSPWRIVDVSELPSRETRDFWVWTDAGPLDVVVPQ